MTHEFLQNFKMGDAPLSKEIIDAIMEENSRDIEAAKKPFADYESIKTQLQTAKDGLKAFEGVDVKDLQGQVAKLTGELAAKEKEHAAQLAAPDDCFDKIGVHIQVLLDFFALLCYHGGDWGKAPGRPCGLGSGSLGRGSATLFTC